MFLPTKLILVHYFHFLFSAHSCEYFNSFTWIFCLTIFLSADIFQLRRVAIESPSLQQIQVALNGSSGLVLQVGLWTIML